MKAYLCLEFADPYVLTIESLLRLRRNLREAVRQGGQLHASAFDALFDSPVALDPYARRRYQRSGPPFVIHPPKVSLPLAISGTLELPFVLLGRGIRLLNEFCLAFQELGTCGFHHGEGFFKLVAVEAEDLGGNRMRVWPSAAKAPLPLPVGHAGWFLDTFAETSQVTLIFQTPARLLSAGRPLFKPSFLQLFPFIMRRVSAMAHAHCDVDLIDDPEFFLEAASRVVELDNRLNWRDWRSLDGDNQRQDLGGVAGSLTISGEGLREILWLLRLGSLLNVGKGAAFAAGHLTLCTLD